MEQGERWSVWVFWVNQMGKIEFKVIIICNNMHWAFTHPIVSNYRYGILNRDQPSPRHHLMLVQPAEY